MSMDLNTITAEVIGSAIEVHRVLGPGLLESVYKRCLVLELEGRGRVVESEVPLAVRYKGQVVQEDGYRLDLLVDGAVVVELKSVEDVKPVFAKQLLTYLRLADKRVGLLINNFNAVRLKDGIERVVNGLTEPHPSASSAPPRDSRKELNP